MEDKYTVEVYKKIQTAINEIEKTFFTSKGKEEFPKLVLSLNNKCKDVCVAYVSPDYLYDTKDKSKVQYLGINPKHLKKGSVELLKTLTHELCHIYELSYIHVPRGGYHTREWHNLMINCGLDPIYMNKSKTSVNEKIIEGGIFTTFAEQFEKDYPSLCNIVEYSQTLEVDNNGKPVADNNGKPVADNADKPIKEYNRNKVKYVCLKCSTKAWGKDGLTLYCGCTAIPVLMVKEDKGAKDE